MKILHISTQDAQLGAPIATNRLHKAMRKAGVDSRMFVLHKMGQDKNVFQVSKLDEKVFAVLKNYITKKITGKTKHEYGLFSCAKLGVNAISYEVVAEADIIYIHWTSSSFLSLSGIEKIIKTGKPVVAVLHDMWHITGGCHHSFDCEKYRTHCHNCQMLMTDKYKDVAYKQFKRKLKMFAKYENISFIAPSQWLIGCVQNSPFAKNKKTKCIPNAIDTTLFRPIDRAIARKILNLPAEKKLICFGAESGQKNPYKGWHYLEKALQNLKRDGEKDIETIIFGSESCQETANKIPFPVHFFGRLHDTYSLMLLYNAVDAFVTPSLADNFPLTCLESLSCGTPVVGFNVGGIPDMIEHRKNGYLAEYKNSEDLAEGIKYILFAGEYETLSQNARDKAISLSSEEKIVEQHIHLLQLK